MIVLHSRMGKLCVAVLGTLILNVFLFVLLPELVREPETGATPWSKTPVQVHWSEPRSDPQLEKQKLQEKISAPREKTPPRSLQNELMPELKQLPGLETRLPELTPAPPLPELDFESASLSEIYTRDAETRISPSPQVYPSDSLDQPVHPTARTPFMYPMRAKRQGTEGWVKVALQVGMQGEVEHVEIVDAEPRGVFEESVGRSIRKWRFSPATVMGEKVKTRVITTIRFELED